MEPLTRSKTTGSPPTDLKARTGDETPPGITWRASSMILSELVVLKEVAVAIMVGPFMIGAGAVAAMKPSARAETGRYSIAG